MDYAILEVNSKQFIVREGDKILVDYIKNSLENSLLFFKTVIYFSKGDAHVIGQPYIEEYKVKALITKSCIKNKKIRVFKKKRRKGYHKTIGHRQKYTEIKIVKIIEEKD